MDLFQLLQKMFGLTSSGIILYSAGCVKNILNEF